MGYSFGDIRLDRRGDIMTERIAATGGTLFEQADAWPSLGESEIVVPPRGPGDKPQGRVRPHAPTSTGLAPTACLDLLETLCAFRNATHRQVMLWGQTRRV